MIEREKKAIPKTASKALLAVKKRERNSWGETKFWSRDNCLKSKVFYYMFDLHKLKPVLRNKEESNNSQSYTSKSCVFSEK